MRKTITLSLVLLTLYASAQKRKSSNTGSPHPSIQLDGGLEFSCALVNGQLWCWGSNAHITSDTVNRISGPVRLAPGKRIKAISCTEEDLIALDEKGIAWGWGYGNWFQNSWQQKNSPILEENYDKRIFPVKLFDSIQWSAVAISRNHFAGIKQDGSLWVVGQDECRVFGNAYYATPWQVGKEHTWINIRLGNVHGAALANDHVLWTWGSNMFSQLGLGKMRTHRPQQDCTPFQPVAPGETWKIIAVSTTNAVAIRQDGSLWFWGDSAYDVFNMKFALVPTRIGGDAVWINASTSETHTLAVREDGSLWAIGKNAHGELGDGTTIRCSKLVRIGKDNDWVSVKAAPIGVSMAVKKNGTIWTWGNNEYGQLGDGTNKDRHAPQQVYLRTF